MATISMINFPDELYERLLRRAADNHRKVDDEIVEAAQRFLDDKPQSLSAEQKLSLSDSVRAQTPGVWITAESIRQARDEGRA